MGNKVEGDIAGWSAEEVGEGAREEKAEGRGAEGREAGQPGRLFDQNGPARSSIRQPYRSVSGGGGECPLKTKWQKNTKKGKWIGR